ncbi:MAG: sigma-54 dependent transcriptional regulator [Acidobacteriota bacterium]|nr:sigma-54 dependent transcriptional regulator [Acidobacteriota bacterium]MDH3785107.1 sigma-54 dependent transcriptional regulator [Acidobacteriota bacterium]
MKKILVVEDEQNLREGIVTAFEDRGWQVSQARDGNEAMSRLESDAFDLVVSDYKMPGASGLEVLRHSKKINETTVVILMTAYGTVETAVEAMRAGAHDYVLKPFDLDELEIKVERAQEHRKLMARVETYRRDADHQNFDNIVGESPQMREVLNTVEKVAHSNATVLVLGETGVGKELVAEALHSTSSRSDQPFVKMNCAALHENLLESELFGHERGAFTGADRQRTGRFELADGGTLFLDEIGNMSLSTQSKVLRVLQEREFERLGGSRTIQADVRVIGATNINLEKAIETGEFREDLYYRLNVVTLNVPPLRERREDIISLCRHFIDKASVEMKKDIRGIDPGAVKVLQRHTWPGNIRELKNTMERAVLLSEQPYIRQEDLHIASTGGVMQDALQGFSLRLPPTGIELEELEKLAILEALRINGWVQKEAAQFLGISSRVMNYKVAKYEITNPRWSKNKAVG